MPTPGEDHAEVGDAVRTLCADFPDACFREIDAQRTFPEAFVEALTKPGWLAARIPQEFSGAGLGLTEASVILEEINRCGGNAGACHGQMYIMGTLLSLGSAAQKQHCLPVCRMATT
jgi:acyl-CoA dehydrogenase